MGTPGGHAESEREKQQTLGEVEMAETSKVVAKKRDRAGKGGARSSRRDGLIPAVIYGDKQAPLMIAVEPKSIERELHKEGFFNHQHKIDVEGQGYDVLPRDVQVDPVTDKPLHLDFLRIGPDSIISCEVPVHSKNEGASPGTTRGGVLNVVLHEITVRTKPASIPEYFEVDLTGLEIGHSIHLSTLTVPEGVRVGRQARLRRRVQHPRRVRLRRQARRLRQPAARPRLRPRSKRRASSPYVRCFCWSGSAIPGHAMRGTGTTLDSWRWTRSSAAVSSRRGVRVSPARWPKAISAASAR